MAKGPSIDHIVQASGVSRSTVFRYFAGKQVRPAAAVAIARAQELLAVPKAPEGREILLSIVPTYARFRGYGLVLEGVLDRARDLGMSVRLGDGGPPQGPTPPPQGVVIVGKGPGEEDAESALWAALGVPSVLVNRIVETPRSWVAVDCRRAARQAVEHLVAQGCRRVATWIDEATRVSCDKKQGYLDALESSGLRADPRLVFGPPESLEEAFDRALREPGGVDGWFAPDDESAIQVLSLAAARGLVVPRDLAVVGMNDITTAAHVVPALTSVRLPFWDMGQAAVDALVRLIDHSWERSVHILLDHELVVRDSSRR